MITLTGQQVINAALKKLGQIIQGETPNTSESNDALVALNNIIDNWGVQRVMAAASVVTQTALTANQQSYTVGTGANINLARPAAVESASLLLASGPGSPVKVITAAEWGMIPDRQSSSWAVRFLFYDRGIVGLSGGTPIGKIWLSPVPLGGTLEIITWQPTVVTYASLATSQVLLDGYARALVLATAMEIAPDYTVSPMQMANVQNEYTEAMAAVRTLNAELMGPEPPPGPVSDAVPPGGALVSPSGQPGAQ